MTSANLISELLAAPLGADWTVERLAEQVLGAIAAQGPDEQEFVLDAQATTDLQARRLLRPLLACLAIRSATEGQTQPNLYGGNLVFQRPGPEGPVWIVGQFENRPGTVRLRLRRCTAPPAGHEAGPVRPAAPGAVQPSTNGAEALSGPANRPGR